MKREYSEIVEIPEGVSCEVVEDSLLCKKENLQNSRKISIPGADVVVKEGKIEIFSKKSNKKTKSFIKTFSAHVKNMLKGLNEKFVYEMEVCHVHFPMTVKVENEKLVITNYLGEKDKRFAKILPDVDVEVKGTKITISSHKIEEAGQTAANIEKATKIYDKDRRVFQDGIFMTSKNGRAI